MRQATINKIDPLDYAATEALNTICTNLTFAGRNLKKIVFTSNTMSEGKSFLVMEIMQNLARRGKRVVLVDADMRRSFLVRRHRIETDGELLGLAHFLVGQCSLSDCLYETNLYGACLIPAGRDVSNPMSLIDSEYFTAMLDDLAANFDVVLIDAPPMNIVSDPLALSALVAGCLFVVRQDFSDHREVRNALISAEMTGMNVLGFIFYGERVHQGGYYYNRKYYHNYYHKYDNRRKTSSGNR